MAASDLTNTSVSLGAPTLSFSATYQFRVCLFLAHQMLIFIQVQAKTSVGKGQPSSSTSMLFGGPPMAPSNLTLYTYVVFTDISTAQFTWNAPGLIPSGSGNIWYTLQYPYK